MNEKVVEDGTSEKVMPEEFVEAINNLNEYYIGSSENQEADLNLGDDFQKIIAGKTFTEIIEIVKTSYITAQYDKMKSSAKELKELYDNNSKIIKNFLEEDAARTNYIIKYLGIRKKDIVDEAGKIKNENLIKELAKKNNLVEKAITDFENKKGKIENKRQIKNCAKNMGKAIFTGVVGTIAYGLGAVTPTIIGKEAYNKGKKMIVRSRDLFKKAREAYAKQKQLQSDK